MSTPALPNSPAPGTRKKKGPLFWILIGVGSLALIGCLVLATGFYFLKQAASNAGVSMDDLKNRPGIAAARLMASLNPDLEIVGDNEDGESIRVRDRKTGKVSTIRVNPQTKALEIEDGEGNFEKFDLKKGQIDVQGSDGSSASFGADTGEALPSWLPSYPGSSPKSNYSGTTDEGKMSTFAFETSDPADKIFDFYEGRLKDNGFTITSREAVGVVNVLAAEDSAHQRRVTVTAPGDGPVMIQTVEGN